MTDPVWIVGVDLSTRQIDAAAIPATGPVGAPRLARRAIEHRKPLDPARRCADAGCALRAALIELGLGPAVRALAIENPIGPFRGADRALLPILGALTMAAWPIPTAWYWPNEWREIIGATGSSSQQKEGGHARLAALYADACHGLDEHQLDAFGVALAHRQTIARHHRTEPRR